MPIATNIIEKSKDSDFNAEAAEKSKDRKENIDRKINYKRNNLKI